MHATDTAGGATHILQRHFVLSVVTPHMFDSRPVFTKGTSLMRQNELPAISVAP